MSRSESEIKYNSVLCSLVKGDVAIDCGANVGNITDKLSMNGATVYAFEPNPYAYNVLKKRFSKRRNVKCIKSAVWDHNTIMKLYLHEMADADQVAWSTGSSLMSSKSNVRNDKYITVKVIDLIEFIENIKNRVKVLKIDIEGAEVEILEHIIRRNLYKKIDYTIVETHEDKLPIITKRMDQIRKDIIKKKIDNIKLDWI